MITRTLAISLTVLLACSLGSAPGSEAEDWFPSKYGAEDTLGAINELSREKVVAAAKLVTAGKTYSLGIDAPRL